jgi:hypothetical protein
MNQETEELFQKWLKLEIAKTKWGLVFRVVTLLLLAVGVIVSARIVEPIVARQLELLDTIQANFIRVSGTQLNDRQSLFDVFRSLSPEEKEQMEQMLQEGR